MENDSYNQLNNTDGEISYRSSNCLLDSEVNSDISLSVLKSEIKKEKNINWKDEIYRGNFMPAFFLLNSNKINVDEIIDDNTENRLLHISLSFSFTNVTRGLIEIFNSELNLKNRFGHTPFHILCNKNNSDIFLFCYMIKNENLLFDERDRNGLTPLFYTIISKHNIEFLILISKKANIYNLDYLGNNSLYFIISSDNKFALNFLIKHCKKFDLNSKYFSNKSCLSEILINSKGRSVTKHIIKYFHHFLDIESLLGSQKRKDKLNFYNNFNYDLLNTLYFYKTKNFSGFFAKLLSFDKIKNYTFKIYNIKFLFFNLILPNMSEKIKYSFFFIYHSLISFLFLNFFFESELIFFDANQGFKFKNILFFIYQICSVISLFSIFFYFLRKKIKKERTCYHEKRDFYFLENSNLYNENSDEMKKPFYLYENFEFDCDNILNLLNQSAERNPLEILFEEELCQICLIKKENSTNHCYICGRCVENYFFHSKLFNICFHKKNIIYYILYFSSLMTIHCGIIYLIARKLNLNVKENDVSIYNSNYFSTNFVTFLLNLDFKDFIYFLFSFYICVLSLQQSLLMFLCLGYGVSYYNMFRMHKKSVGKLESRKGKISNIPYVNSISICRFIGNLIKKIKNIE